MKNFQEHKANPIRNIHRELSPSPATGFIIIRLENWYPKKRIFSWRRSIFVEYLFKGLCTVGISG